MTDPDLVRFLEAQATVYVGAMAELRAGRKASHWMWFVFPQIAGLGFSAMSRRYAIADLDQAERYLAHPVLGARLREGVAAMLAHETGTARDILGTPDDMKLRSCLTLFREASESDDDRALFQAALDRFYEGKADRATLTLLADG